MMKKAYKLVFEINFKINKVKLIKKGDLNH